MTQRWLVSHSGPIWLNKSEVLEAHYYYGSFSVTAVMFGLVILEQASVYGTLFVWHEGRVLLTAKQMC